MTPLIDFLGYAKKRPKRDLEKGEFETTAEFKSRLNAYHDQDARKGLIVIEIPVDRSHLTYDADAQLLRINSNAFRVSNLDIELWSWERKIGQYTGVNPFGVSVTVESRHERRVILRSDTPEDRLFYRRMKADYGPSLEVRRVNHEVAQIGLNSSEAKNFKNTAVAYLAVEYPRLSLETYEDSKSAKIDDPVERSSEVDIISGVVSCAAIGVPGSQKIVFDWETPSSRELFLSGGILNIDLGRTTTMLPTEATRIKIITRPDWKRKPTSEEMVALYPDLAQKMEVNGRAVLSCKVALNGSLNQCEVVSENPEGYGFGAAALSASSKFIMNPKTIDGQEVSGGEINIPIVFSVPL